MMQLTLIAVCASAVALLLFGEYRDDRRLKWTAKPMASLAFVALAIASGAAETDYGRFIFLGLVLCLIGDVLLITRSPRYFLGGMAAFALGHLAYAASFLTIWAGFSVLFFIACALIVLSLVVIFRWFWPHLGAFRAPVGAYCVIIGIMTALSFSTASPFGGTPYGLAVLGAVGFAVSDIAVARDQFVKAAFLNRLWGLPLYYGAQLLLAASV